MGECITSLRHLQCSLPIPTFSSSVRCFELEAEGMLLPHARNPGFKIKKIAQTELLAAYTLPKEGMCQEHVACLEQDRP